MAADMIVVNAKVLTMDPAKPRADAVALGGGKVLAVGTRADVEAVASAPTKAAPAKAVPTKAAREPLGPAAPGDHATAMRQAIAALMARSKREIPHYYLQATIDVEHALTSRLCLCCCRRRCCCCCIHCHPDCGCWFGGSRESSLLNFIVCDSFMIGDSSIMMFESFKCLAMPLSSHSWLMPI